LGSPFPSKKIGYSINRPLFATGFLGDFNPGYLPVADLDVYWFLKTWLLENRSLNHRKNYL